MDFINTDIQDYSESHSEGESELLKHINRDTHTNVIMPRMLSGHMSSKQSLNIPTTRKNCIGFEAASKKLKSSVHIQLHLWDNL